MDNIVHTSKVCVSRGSGAGGRFPVCVEAGGAGGGRADLGVALTRNSATPFLNCCIGSCRD